MIFQIFFCILILSFSSLGIADDVAIGNEIYHENCSACHGKEMLKPGLAFDLKKFPKEDFQRFRNSVLNGKGSGMPAWSVKLSEEDIKLLWLYVKTASDI